MEQEIVLRRLSLDSHDNPIPTPTPINYTMGVDFIGLVRMILPQIITPNHQQKQHNNTHLTNSHNHHNTIHQNSSLSRDYQTFALTLEEFEELEHQLKCAAYRLRYPSVPGAKLWDVEFSFGSLFINLVTTRNFPPLYKLRLGSLEITRTFTNDGRRAWSFSVFILQLEDTWTIQPVFPTKVKSLNKGFQSERDKRSVVVR